MLTFATSDVFGKENAVRTLRPREPVRVFDFALALSLNYMLPCRLSAERLQMLAGAWLVAPGRLLLSA